MDWGPGWVPPINAPDLGDWPHMLAACDDIAAAMGWRLWGFQRHMLAAWTAYEPGSGSWIRTRCLAEVSRQNGKSLGMRVRAGLGLLLGEGMSITAQRLHVAERIWYAATDLLEAEEPSRVVSKRLTQGRQALVHTAPSGVRREWLLVSDTPAAARSHTNDVILVDEGAWINQRWLAAALGTGVTVADGQTIQVSNSGAVESETWNTEVETGLDAQDNGDPSVAVLRWGADWDDDPYSLDTWAKANPTLDLPGGVQSRKLQEYLDRGMSLPDFRREHLGLGSGRRDPVVKSDDWEACHGDVGEPRGGGWIGIDTSPDSSHSAIAAAWPIGGRRVACALVATMDGDARLWKETVAARRAYRARGITVDSRNPAVHVRSHAKGARIRCEVAGASAAAAAAAGLAAAAQDRQLVIESSDPLDAAARDAIRRPLAEGWAMNRNPRQGKAPISALVALSLAVAQCQAAPGDAPVSSAR